MSLSQANTTGKMISIPAVLSTFIGVMAAIPLALALYTAAPAGAVPSVDQPVTAQSNVDDFAAYAHAFNQGYEASAITATGCSDQSMSAASVKAEGQATAHTGGAHANVAHIRGMGAGGHGGHVSHHKNAKAKKMAERAVAMTNSYNSYVSTVNNHATTTNTHTNVNSNNTVGSNNTTRTAVNVDDSRGVVVGVSSDTTTVQNNASESFNNDSYNTKTENTTTVINDSFKNDTDNTETTIIEDSFKNDSQNTSNVTVDVNKETNINEEVTVTNDSHNTRVEDSNNTTETNVRAEVDVNSHNDTSVDAVLPLVAPVPQA